MFSSFGKCCFKDKKAIHVHTNQTSHKELPNESQDEDIDNPYDFLAPSVFHLQTAFLETMISSGLSENSTVYEIENLQDVEPGLIRRKGIDVTCPVDGKNGAAYVHCLEGADHVGEATHMLSYAWGYTYKDIVDTLVKYCDDKGLDTKRTYIWICALCNNQHRVVERDVPFTEFKQVFHKKVRGIGHVLALMTPWNDPGYLKRVWCIFEMHTANVDNDVQIEIIMPPIQKKSLIAAVTKPADGKGTCGLDDLFAALASTKVENAQASRELDKQNILKLIEESNVEHGDSVGMGSFKVNADVNALLRTWIRDTVLDAVATAEKELEGDGNGDSDGDSDGNTTASMSRRETATFLTFCASFFSRSGAHQEAMDLHQKGLDIYLTIEDTEDSKELAARCYNNIGTECESLGQYDRALEMHHKCREAFEEIYGLEHENTSVSYFNIGAVLKKLDRNEEAMEMYQKSLDIDRKIKGDNHIDVALSYSYIGRIKQHNADYDGALEMFTMSLKIREETYGDQHPDAAIGYGDLGLLKHMLGEYDDAIAFHKKALTIQRVILGDLHPDTAAVFQNIGGAYYEKGMQDEALRHHNKAVQAYETTLGIDHPKSATARQWVEIVKDAM